MELCTETLNDIKNDIISIILNAFLNKEMIRTKVCTQGEDYQVEMIINIKDSQNHCAGDVTADFIASIRYLIPETIMYGPEVLLGTKYHLYRKSDGIDWLSEFSEVFATEIVDNLSTV